jgi:two-component system, OmpR family, sensor histidine kinase KdpD
VSEPVMWPQSVLRRGLLLARMLASTGAVALITALYFRVVMVNPTTVALTYVVAILFMATQWGIAEATAGSIVAAICFNVFFLPPIGDMTIADPQNWVAYVAFLVTAIVTSQLTGRARQRDVAATARQRHVERLYALSRALLLTDGGVSTPAAIARHIADVFELQTVALFDRRADTVAWGGAVEPPPIEARLRAVPGQAAPERDPSGMIVTAIQLAGAPIGTLAIMDAGLGETVLQSIANLAAIGLERARGQDEKARAEAARQSGELRATVLDALAHEFKTPLTSMEAAASDLLLSESIGARDRELVVIIDEEVNRLQALVTDAVRMLRIDAGDFVVHRDRHSLADVVRSTLRQFEPRLDGHRVVSHVPEDLSVDADRDLLSLALRQLLDNAVKYSPELSLIDIAATGGDSVEIVVHDSGPAIPEREQARIFERFYRGTGARQIPGSGMGLAIVQQIARSHGGVATVTSTAAGGTQFKLRLPRGEPGATISES